MDIENAASNARQFDADRGRSDNASQKVMTMRANQISILAFSCLYCLSGCFYGELKNDPTLDAVAGSSGTTKNNGTGGLAVSATGSSTSTGQSIGGATLGSGVGTQAGGTRAESQGGTSATGGGTGSGGQVQLGGSGFGGTGTNFGGGGASNVGGANASGGGSSSGGTSSSTMPITTGGVSAGGSGVGGSSAAGMGAGTSMGGTNTGGLNAGGVTSGGSATGGTSAGGSTTGGTSAGGVATGGASAGGVATGGASTGGVATGGTSATGGASPTGGSGPTCTGTTPVSGCPCATSNALACSGVASKVKLICSGSPLIWTTSGTCDANNNCKQSDGTCHPIIDGCRAATNGKFCDSTSPTNDALLTCDADLVTTTSEKCAGICSAGACQTPICGDKKVEKTGGMQEECDDGGGDTTPADGCEKDCKNSKVIDMALGSGFTCALLRLGYVRCWGNNDYNQLGLGYSSATPANATPYQLSDINGNKPIDLGGEASSIAAGANHVCALLTNGKVTCWGDNQLGQLGLGDANVRLGTVPSTNATVKFDVGNTMTAKAIAAGGDKTCAILSDNSVRCWGTNTSGQLGLGNTTDMSGTSPSSYASVSLGADAIGLAVGSLHSCAILAGGTSARCWGRNAYGQLGTANTAAHINVGAAELPSSLGAAGLLLLPLNTSIQRISSEGAFSCALLGDGRIECWGMNTNWQIGSRNDKTAIGDDESPVTYGMTDIGSAQATRVVTGYSHTCALLSGQGLKCWGSGTWGQLGMGTNVDQGPYPSALSAISVGAGLTVQSVWVGWDHTCVLLSDDTVKCWGRNDGGQLGTGSAAPDRIGIDASTTPDRLSHVQIFNAN